MKRILVLALVCLAVVSCKKEQVCYKCKLIDDSRIPSMGDFFGPIFEITDPNKICYEYFSDSSNSWYYWETPKEFKDFIKEESERAGIKCKRKWFQ
jgi:hypothetical protein